jgi:hypothetical protein
MGMMHAHLHHISACKREFCPFLQTKKITGMGAWAHDHPFMYDGMVLSSSDELFFLKKTQVKCPTVSD